MKTPYGIGYNGHARCCDCNACAKMRAEAVLVMTKTPFLGGEVSPERTVYVRAHFRRGKNHLSRYPNTRAMVRSVLRKVRS